MPNCETSQQDSICTKSDCHTEGDRSTKCKESERRKIFLVILRRGHGKEKVTNQGKECKKRFWSRCDERCRSKGEYAEKG